MTAGSGQTSRDRPLSWLLRGAIVAGALIGLSWLERRRRLRRRVEPELPHVARNVAIAGLGALAVQMAEAPLVNRLSGLVGRRGWGLLPRLGLPSRAEALVAVLLLDYTLFLWHALVHKVPLLWRAHAVHHIDRDLDATTALRFHFAELVASVPWRAGQVLLIGVGPRPLSIWQTFLMTSILFHHSNLDLGPAAERVIGRLLVTPRMHGIHHSRVAAEAHSNWSSGLSLWDWLHGTLRLDVPQDTIRIGVPTFDTDEDVALGAMLALPFSRADVQTLETATRGGQSTDSRRGLGR